MSLWRHHKIPSPWRGRIYHIRVAQLSFIQHRSGLGFSCLCQLIHHGWRGSNKRKSSTRFRVGSLQFDSTQQIHSLLVYLYSQIVLRLPLSSYNIIHCVFTFVVDVFTYTPWIPSPLKNIKNILKKLEIQCTLKVFLLKKKLIWHRNQLQRPQISSLEINWDASVEYLDHLGFSYFVNKFRVHHGWRRR